MAKTLYYKHEDQTHPLREGEYDTAFKIYKSDRRKAVIGSPHKCIEALGLQRQRDVAFAHIGSGGDAYVGYRDKNSKTGITVRHFTIPAAAARIRDTFDARGSPSTQVVMLKAPSNGRTLTYRRTLQKNRYKLVKTGAVQSTKRTKPSATRVERLGVAHRPRPKVVGGQVSFHKA
jgi:hypothetical protein